MKDHEKYEFNLSDPQSWTKMPRPLLSKSFIAETLKIGGLNKYGNPRFKWSWGMSEEVYVEGDKFIQSGWYLKYEMCTTGNKLVGFRWQGDNGKLKFVDDMRKIPHECLTAIPVYHREQVGTPRWVLEEWRDKGDCNGVYDLDGYYFHRWIVADDMPAHPETLLKPYREPNQKDLEILAHYVQLTATLTDDDIRKGVEANKEIEAKAKAAKKELDKVEIDESIVQIMTDLPTLNMPKPSKAAVAKAASRLNSYLTQKQRSSEAK